MLSWGANNITPLSVEVIAGNATFAETLPTMEIFDTYLSSFLSKLNEFGKLVFNLRPEFKWVEFKVNGYVFRTTMIDIIEQDNQPEEYDDGYPTF